MVNAILDLKTVDLTVLSFEVILLLLPKKIVTALLIVPSTFIL